MTAAEDDQLTPAGLASAALEEIEAADDHAAFDRPDLAALALQRAQVYATLALAGEQRTANLLAFTLRRMAGAEVRRADPASIERIQNIAERLDLQ